MLDDFHGPCNSEGLLPGVVLIRSEEPLGDGASGRALGHGSVGPWALFPPVY